MATKEVTPTESAIVPAMEPKNGRDGKDGNGQNASYTGENI